jgi:hypothetical protein
VADIDRRRAMVIGRPAMGTGHHRVTVIGHPATAATARRLVMVSDRPAGAIDLPEVVETGHRPEVAVVLHRMVAGRLVAVMEIAPRKVATVLGRKPNLQVNKSHDKRREYRGVCHLPHGHQPCPVRA